MPDRRKKKVIIIGAGISGMTAGIYLLDNGFDVEIFERHEIPGGACSGWVREGQYIEGCAHWIIGTNPESSLYPLWEHIGAFDDSIRIYPTHDLTTFDLDGKPFPLLNDLKQLQDALIEMSPEDKRMIKKFVRTIRRYAYIHIPTKKPIDLMNPFELLAFGLSMAPVAISYATMRKVSITDYAKKFKDPRIGKLFLRFFGNKYNAHSLFYVFQAFFTKDAGIVEGGSLRMATRVGKTFVNNGGKLHLNAPVSRILFDGKTAKGIELESGEILRGDYIISATDTYETFHHLAPEVKMPAFLKQHYDDLEHNPLQSAFQISMQTTADLSDKPRMIDFEIEETEVAKAKYTNFAVRNFSYDATISRGKKTLLTILLPTLEETYDYLASLGEEEYKAEKKRIGDLFLALTAKKLGIPEESIKLLDVVTPLTYHHYTKAHKGAYMSFVTTNKTKGLIMGTRVKGYRNLLLAGQWLMPPGGLPIAIIVGKHAAYSVCHQEKIRFQNKEKIKVRGKLRIKAA